MSISSNSFLKKYQNKIIFFCVTFFALHWIFFTWAHKINVPYSMEFLPIEIVYDFMTTDIFQVQELFIPTINNHILTNVENLCICVMTIGLDLIMEIYSTIIEKNDRSDYFHPLIHRMTGLHIAII